jgi:3-deoxy-D-manno-octulosonic-acid transferase
MNLLINSRNTSPIKRQLTLLLYNFLLVIFILVDFTKWVLALVKQAMFFILRKPLKGTEKRDWYWGQKYGLVSKSLTLDKNTQSKRVMIHCASVGEVVAAIPLIKKLLTSNDVDNISGSELSFVVTTNTKTGKEQLFRLLDEELKVKVSHTYLPIDLPWLMSSLLKQVQPDLLIIMEVELWPNLINQCYKYKNKKGHKIQLPVCIVNARLTDKTRRGYQKLTSLSEPMTQQLHQVYARNQTDFDNYLAMGINPDKLSLLGNIKFDIEPADMSAAQELRDALNLTKRKVIIAGSSHEGEESLLVEAYQQFKTQYPDLILIICPRHPERFISVFEYLTSQQLNVVKMSESESAEITTDVLLGDQMGQLSKLYGVCDIAFVGGSFAKRGGHNPIEAAAFAKPIIMGPHVYNNPEICNTLANDGGLVIANNHFEFVSQLNTWLSDQELSENTGKKALATLQNNAGIINTLSTELLRTLNAKNDVA